MPFLNEVTDLSDHSIRKMLKAPDFIAFNRQLNAAIKQDVGEGTIGINMFLDQLNKQLPETKGISETSEIHEFYSNYLHYAYGEKIYAIAPNLMRRLNSTNIASVPTEFFRLPFRTIMMTFSGLGIKFRTTSDNVIREADELIISELRRSEMIGEKFSADYEVPGFPKKTADTGIKVFLRSAPYFAYFWIWLEKDELHACVDDSINHLKYIHTHNKDVFQHMGNQLSAPDEAMIRDQFETVMKLILYINGANSDIYWQDDRPQLEAQLRRTVAASKRQKIENTLAKTKPHYKVGHRIVLTREEREMYDAIRKGTLKITSRFVVQGHFRHQAYGEHFSKRKLIFIEPFWKGPAFGEVISNEHIVK